MSMLSICARDLMLNHLFKRRILGQDIAATTRFVDKVQECYTDEPADQEDDIEPIEKRSRYKR